MKDLLVYVADKNAEGCLRGGLERHRSLDIRPITYEFIGDDIPGDGGARTRGVDSLRLLRSEFFHALLIFDFEGCGENTRSAVDLEQSLDQQLAETWQDRAKCIIPEPEIDIWMWGSDNSMAQALEVKGGLFFRDWLRGKNFVFDANAKPERPKEALETTFRNRRIPRSSANYQKLANRISLQACTDPAFLRLKNQLQTWFPPSVA